MDKNDHDGNGEPSPTLADRLLVSQHGDGYAFRPGHLIIRGDEAQLGRIREIAGGTEDRAPVADRHGLSTRRLTGVEDEIAVIEQLRAEGLDAQPEHVLFAHARAHGCDGGCGPHPADSFELLRHGAGAFGADPFRANPFRANPFRANPFRANPFRANPFRANPFRANGTPTSTAEPASGREFALRTGEASGALPRIVVLDTGLAGDDQRPELLTVTPDRAGRVRIDGTSEVADAAIEGRNGVVHPPDGYLDPVAGHGTFIAGLIEQVVPGCSIAVRHVVAPLGDVSETDVERAIEAEIARAADARPHIISMSFGGHLSEGSFALRDAIAAANREGVLLVASAGNDGLCLPNYPAAFDHVIAVAALGPDGPAPWTNFGPWVDACAPGTDLVSSFFSSFDGKLPKVNGVDPDRFRGWACWSGTSFAAPMVVAALAREMVATSCNAAEAADRVIHAPHLFRLPCLGTVVNI